MVIDDVVNVLIFVPWLKQVILAIQIDNIQEFSFIILIFVSFLLFHILFFIFGCLHV